MKYEEERPRPLDVAFMGYSSELTRRFIRQFCEDNRESVRSVSEKRIILTDETRIIAISPSMARNRLDGYRFDQLILADDEREMIRDTYAKEIEIITRGYMAISCVPEEFRVLYYNPFAAEPCAECGRPGEVIRHRPASSPGVVFLCRECHERAHAGAYTMQGLAEGLTIGADKFAEAFRRLAEALVAAIEEIEAVRADPSLSRFQKWWRIRKIKRRRP